MQRCARQSLDARLERCVSPGNSLPVHGSTRIKVGTAARDPKLHCAVDSAPHDAEGIRVDRRPDPGITSDVAGGRTIRSRFPIGADGAQSQADLIPIPGVNGQQVAAEEADGRTRVRIRTAYLTCASCTLRRSRLAVYGGMIAFDSCGNWCLELVSGSAVTNECSE